MSKQSYTPGPWETCGNVVRTARRPEDMSGLMVAECPVTNERRAEDARLIAAAPDLLEALQRLIATGLHEREYHELMSNPMHYARAAIAKALGG